MAVGLYHEELPCSGDAAQLYGAAVGEPESGAGDQILDGARDHNHAGLRRGRHSSSDGHGDAGDLLVKQFALPRMQAGADLDAEFTDPVANRTRAANGPGRSVEDREEPVAGGVKLSAAEAGELSGRPFVRSCRYRACRTG